MDCSNQNTTGAEFQNVVNAYQNKMAAAAAAGNGAADGNGMDEESEERASKEQLKMIRLKSLKQRKEGTSYKPDLEGLGESKRERGSIMQRTSILFVGDLKRGKKGLFSCCLGGSEDKYEVKGADEIAREESEEEEEDAW